MEEINSLMIMRPQTYKHLRIDNVNHPLTSPSTNQRIVPELITDPEAYLEAQCEVLGRES